MKNNYSNSKVFFLFTANAFSQGDNSIWTTISENKISQEKLFRKSQPTEAVFYSFNNLPKQINLFKVTQGNRSTSKQLIIQLNNKLN